MLEFINKNVLKRKITKNFKYNYCFNVREYLNKSVKLCTIAEKHMGYEFVMNLTIIRYFAFGEPQIIHMKPEDLKSRSVELYVKIFKEIIARHLFLQERFFIINYQIYLGKGNSLLRWGL